MQKLNITILIAVLTFSRWGIASGQQDQQEFIIEQALDNLERRDTDYFDDKPLDLESIDLPVNQAIETEEIKNFIRNKEYMIDVLEFQNEDIREVIDLIELKTGLKIKVKEDVDAYVTIFLKDVEAHDALRIILDANGFAFSKEGEFIEVMTAEEFELRFGYPFGKMIQTRIINLSFINVEDTVGILNQIKSNEGKVLFNDETQTIILMDSIENLEAMQDFIKEIDVPVEEKTFELRFVEAQDILKDVQELLTDNIGRVQYDSAINQIIVTDTSAKIEEVTQFISRIDQKEKAINIQTRIIQITLNDEHLNGVDWEAIVSNFQSHKFLGLIDGNNETESNPKDLICI